MYLDIRPAVMVLAADPLPEALSKAMVLFEKTGTVGGWDRLGDWCDERGAASVALAAVIDSRHGMISRKLGGQHEAGRLPKTNGGDCNGYAGEG